uniref:C2H2-type domain-containing protein n=3 Tax=Stomoxys calcitrans TaxID=35570 RepID=A0A1I8NUH4_STOCA|nr:unnamed protein product [Stomoxys calcitrans]
MEKYADYLRCGEIYKSPSHSNKTPYILKCYQCADIFLLLESFIFHIEDYCNADQQNDAVTVVIDEQQEPKEDIENIEECDDASVMVKNEPIKDIEYEEIVMVEDSGNVSVTPEGGSSTDDADEGCEGFVVYEIVDISDAENDSKKPADNPVPSFVSKFMESRTNVIELIAMYKRFYLNSGSAISTGLKLEPHDLEKLTVNFNAKRRLNLTSSQIGAIIYHLHHEYSQYLKDTNDNKGSDTTSKPSWYFQFLNFLDTTKEKSLYEIEDYPTKLSKDIILKILDIYKDFPQLWDTELVEYCCNNKRREALEAMLEALKAKIALKLNLNSLKKYLQSIHSFYQKEKKNHMSGTEFTLPSSEISHKDMEFLSAHVGPFQCPYCDVEIKCPFSLKIHKFSSHGGCIPFNCSLCRKQFRTSNLYIYHAKWHMNDLTIECKLCNKKFINASELKTHMVSHNQQKSFKSLQPDLKSTNMSTTDVANKRFKTTPVKNTNSITLRGFHKCSECGIAFRMSKSLHNHMQLHRKM